VGLIDLGAKRVLFRLREKSDPSWITAARRNEYASGLDGCVLALDVIDAITKPKPAEAHPRH
jgi:hypothetical protein